jgi:hypothetical protein
VVRAAEHRRRNLKLDGLLPWAQQAKMSMKKSPLTKKKRRPVATRVPTPPMLKAISIPTLALRLKLPWLRCGRCDTSESTLALKMLCSTMIERFILALVHDWVRGTKQT